MESRPARESRSAPDPLLPVALFSIAAVAFGTSFVAIKAGLATLPPLFYAGLRFDVGAALLLVALAAMGRLRRPRTRGDWGGVGAGSLLLIAGNGGLLFIGQRSVTSATAATIYSFLPILTPIFAVLALPDERLSARGAGGVLIAFVGVVVLAAPDPSAGHFAGGHLLVVGATISAALGAVLIRRAGATIPATSLTAWSMVAGAGLLHAASLVAAESPPALVALSPALVAVSAYLGSVSTAVAFAA